MSTDGICIKCNTFSRDDDSGLCFPCLVKQLRQENEKLNKINERHAKGIMDLFIQLPNHPTFVDNNQAIDLIKNHISDLEERLKKFEDYF